MKFIDEASISVRSGDGGRGCVSFRRERHIPKGGPDGGDGGRGGHVIFKTTSRKRTLLDFKYKKIFNAQKGGYGRGSRKTGKDGVDLILEIPTGTLIKNSETDELLCDMVEAGQVYMALEGGMGGRGNARFKTSTNRAPRHAQPGVSGQSLELKLELKLLADVGIIGLPNAGKSTLISALSSATPKIADYPFTTLTPNLGVVQTDWTEPFTLADIPGLIEGAHAGAGLGIRFLKHIERTRILVHMIDISSIDVKNPLAGFTTVNKELAEYDESLGKRSQIVVLNKMDMLESREKAEIFSSESEIEDLIEISALDRKGLDRLKSKIVQMLDADAKHET